MKTIEIGCHRSYNGKAPENSGAFFLAYWQLYVRLIFIDNLILNICHFCYYITFHSGKYFTNAMLSNCKK